MQKVATTNKAQKPGLDTKFSLMDREVPDAEGEGEDWGVKVG